MAPNSFSLRVLLACSLTFSLTWVASSVQAQAPYAVPGKNGQAASKANQQRNAKNIFTNLQAWFKKYANAEGNWGKLETAKAFGYKTPYDAATPGTKTAPKSSTEEPKDELPVDPESLKARNKMTSGTSKSTRRDKLFMDAVDADSDQIITKSEFDAWAKDYADDLAAKQQQLQNAMNLAQLMAMLQNMRNNMGRNPYYPNNRRNGYGNNGNPNGNRGNMGGTRVAVNNSSAAPSRPAPKPAAKPAPKAAPKPAPKPAAKPAPRPAAKSNGGKKK